MRFIPTILIVCLASVLNAQTIPKRLKQWEPNLCRLIVSDSKGASRGSGVYLGNGLVLTAYHVLRDYHREGQRGTITVKFNDGSWSYSGKMVGWSSSIDTATIRINIPKQEDIRGVLLAPADPKVGLVSWLRSERQVALAMGTDYGLFDLCIGYD